LQICVSTEGTVDTELGSINSTELGKGIEACDGLCSSNAGDPSFGMLGGKDSEAKPAKS